MCKKIGRLRGKSADLYIGSIYLFVVVCFTDRPFYETLEIQTTRGKETSRNNQATQKRPKRMFTWYAGVGVVYQFPFI